MHYELDPLIPAYESLQQIWNVPITIAFIFAWLSICLATAGLIIRILGWRLWNRYYVLVLFTSFASYIAGIWGIGVGIVRYPFWEFPEDFWPNVRDLSYFQAIHVTLLLHALYGITLALWGLSMLADLIWALKRSAKLKEGNPTEL